MIFATIPIFVLLFQLGSCQFGCGQQPRPFPAPPIFPQPCQTLPPPPIVQPPPPNPNCRGCPVNWQLPQLVPVPRVYPETPPGLFVKI